jgi:hypothetical protein
MTQREYERLRRGGFYRSGRQEKNGTEDGYFAFFKLRCLICFVLFLGFVAVDRRVDVSSQPVVKQFVQSLNEETIPSSLIFSGKSQSF